MSNDSDIISALSSDFVSTLLLERLYRLCCDKRFRANAVEIAMPIPQIILSKYLILPKDKPPSPPMDPGEQSKETNPSYM